jgi:hypothetical protein
VEECFGMERSPRGHSGHKGPVVLVPSSQRTVWINNSAFIDMKGKEVRSGLRLLLGVERPVSIEHRRPGMGPRLEGSKSVNLRAS